MIMAEQRRAQDQIIPITTRSNYEEGDQLRDTTASPLMTSTTTVVLTTLNNVSIPTAPAATDTINTFEMAGQTLNKDRGGVVAMPQVG